MSKILGPTLTDGALEVAGWSDGTKDGSVDMAWRVMWKAPLMLRGSTKHSAWCWPTERLRSKAGPTAPAKGRSTSSGRSRETRSTRSTSRGRRGIGRDARSGADGRGAPETLRRSDSRFAGQLVVLGASEGANRWPCRSARGVGRDERRPRGRRRLSRGILARRGARRRL